MSQTGKVEGLGVVGYVADLEPVDLPPNAWSFLQNVRCKDGSIHSFDGSETVDTITPAPDTIEKVQVGESSHLVYAAGTKIYSWIDGTETDISLRDYNAGSRWDSCNLGGVAIFTTIADNPQYWGGEGSCVDLPYNADTGCTWSSVGMTASVIRPFKNYLFALDVNDCSGRNRRRLVWSHPADPGTVPVTWDITDATKDAGDHSLTKTPGAILDGLVLRDTLQIYKEDAIYSVTFTGGTYVFNFRLVSSSHGLYARNCVCDIGGKHVFVGKGDIYLYDGVNINSIADRRVRDLFFGGVNRSTYDETFVVFHEKANEVWLCYPSTSVTGTVCDKALVWSVEDNTWSPRDIPEARTAIHTVVKRSSAYTWDTLPYATWNDWGTTPPTPTWTSWDGLTDSEPIFESLILAGSGKLYEMDRTNQDDGVNITCIARRTHLDLGDTGDWHMVTTIRPKATGSAFRVRVGMHDVINDAVSWSDYQTFTPGTDYKLNFRVTGRLHAIEFSSITAATWEISGYEFDYAFAGRRS